VQRAFQQVDVFTTTPCLGNPVAVVLDAVGLSDEEMARFARWTNLSETTFVLPPEADGADYRVRLAFAAPPLLRSGPPSEALVQHLAAVLGIDRGEIVDAEWVDNGPGWVAVLLGSAEAVLALRPGITDLDLGAVGPYPPGSPQAFEVRAFFPKDGGTVEDPVTGSLNASLAEWLLRTGRATAPYVASQGTVLGREGRVHVSRDEDGTIWVGGGTITCVAGQVSP
jgi:predicted PhzF superfamily epimerase YddE/YHI9